MATSATSDVHRTCLACGAAFSVTAHEMAYLRGVAERDGWPCVRPPARCLACRGIKRQADRDLTCAPPMPPGDTAVERQCVECRAWFWFRPQDQIFYHEQNLSPPKRCPDCRRSARARRVRRGPS